MVREIEKGIMAIKSALDKMVSFSIFMLLFFFLVMFLLRITSKDLLYGVTLSHYPRIDSFEDIWNGTFQKEWEKWFSDNFYGHTFIVKCHNQLEYSVFHDGNGVWIQGKDGYLFNGEQTYSYVAGVYGNTYTRNELDEYAKDLAELQARMEKKGKGFLLLLTPYKAEIYPEYLPWNDRILFKKYANEGQSIHDLLLESLNKYSVKYYDITSDLISMKESEKYDIYSKTGHHWTLTAAVNELSRLAQNCIDIQNISDWPCIEMTDVEKGLYETDQDSLKLQNVFFPDLSDCYFQPEINYPKRSGLNLYLFGTSFGEQIRDAYNWKSIGHAFNNFVYQSYFVYQIVSNKDEVTVKNYMENSKMREFNILGNLRDCDFLLIEQQGSMGAIDTHKKFLKYVNENFDLMYYKLGDNIITFSDDSETVLFDNFWLLEDWGRWSKGQSSKITVYTQLSEMCMDKMYLGLTAASYATDNEVDILLNGRYISTLEVHSEYSDYIIPVSSDYLCDGKNTIEFVLKNRTYTPQEVVEGEAGDRDLGLGIKNLYLNRRSD